LADLNGIQVFISMLTFWYRKLKKPFLAPGKLLMIKCQLFASLIHSLPLIPKHSFIIIFILFYFLSPFVFALT